MKLESIEYLRRLGIEAWVERASNVHRSTRDTVVERRQSKTEVPRDEQKSRSQDREFPNRPKNTSSVSTAPSESEKTQNAQQSRDVGFEAHLNIHIHENVCIVDSIGVNSFVDDLLVFVAKFKQVKPSSLNFDWPTSPATDTASQDYSLEAAVAGFSGFFHYSVLPVLNVSSHKMLLLLLGPRAVQIAGGLEEYPSNVVAIETLPSTAKDKRELWFRLIQTTT